MPSVREVKHAMNTVLLALSSALLIALDNRVFAQERDSEYVVNESPSVVAKYMLDNFDLVAVGEFGAPTELGSDQISLLKSRELDLEFTPRIVYKAGLRSDAAVVVRLRSDMLSYPGENVSRYEKRLVEVERSRNEILDIGRRAEDLETRLTRGEVTRFEHNRQLESMESANHRAFAEAAELRQIQRQIFVSHGGTFYDKGGVILSNTPYLIALDAIDGNAGYYFLDDGVPGFNILWGDFSADVRAEIERLRETARADGRVLPAGENPVPGRLLR